MPSPDTTSPGSPKPPPPVHSRPPEDLLDKKWEELTPEDHARLDAYIAGMLGRISGS
jgi:hypothetical protein